MPPVLVENGRLNNRPFSLLCWNEINLIIPPGSTPRAIQKFSNRRYSPTEIFFNVGIPGSTCFKATTIHRNFFAESSCIILKLIINVKFICINSIFTEKSWGNYNRIASDLRKFNFFIRNILFGSANTYQQTNNCCHNQNAWNNPKISGFVLLFQIVEPQKYLRKVQLKE